MALSLRFLGANPDVRLEGRREVAAKISYLTGGDPAKWRTGLATYQEVVYRDLWPGVALVFRHANGKLKYEFVLQPGARVEAIRLAYRGAEGVALDAAGNLLIRTPLGVLTDEQPKSHQIVEGTRIPVESHFALAGGGSEPNAYGFTVGAGYDSRYPLVIDPGLEYLALVGGTSADVGNAIAVDGSGSAYLTGKTDSADFPTTAGAFDRSFGGGSKNRGISDAFVAKLDPTGELVWVTFLGGGDADAGLGIALVPGCPSNCNPYVTGFTYSADFPVFPKPGAFSTKISGNADAFVAQLRFDGSGLVYSTFLGGGGFDAGHAVAVDALGNAYVTGESLSSTFPITPFAVFASSQGKKDAFVTKLNPSGSAPLVYSTYLGGNGDDVGFGIALACDPAGFACNAVVTGQTSSPNFPTTLSFPTKVLASVDTSLNGPTDAFVAKLKADGSQLLSSTYLGGSGDEAGLGVAVDGAGSAHVTGQTNSTTFPATPGAFQGALNLNAGVATVDAFVTKFTPDGSALVYSTFLGGSGHDAGLGIAVACVDPTDPTKCSAVVTGQTTSANFPMTSTAGAFNTSYGGNTDAFVTKLKIDGSGLFYSTFLGGSGTDAGLGIALPCTPSDCDTYVTGQTSSHSDTFPPTVGNPLNLSGDPLNANADAFVAKLDVRASTSTALISSVNPSVFGQSVKFTATVTSPVGMPTGTVTFKDGTSPLGTGTLNASGLATFTTASLPVGSHSITAEYGGDGNFLASTSPALTQTVNKADTSTAVSSSVNPSVFGQSVILTATVSPVAPGTGAPSGTVTFKDGTSPLGTGTVDASGRATLTTSSLPAGSHSITAEYGGDGNFNGSLATFVQTVNRASTTTAAASSVNPSVYSQPVTFTATVSVVAPGVGTPTGTVTFKDGATVLGTAALSGAAQATLTVSLLGAGTHAITAEYGGNPDFEGSASPALAQTVNKATTTTMLVSSLNPSHFGQPVTFTATVGALPPATTTPTGSVDFFDALASLGSASLSTGSGAMTTSSLTAQFHPITAVYGETANFLGSTSPVLGQTVISTPMIFATDRQDQASGLYLGCKNQPVTITGQYFQPPTTPSNLVVTVGGSGVTVTSVEYSSSTTIFLVVDVAATPTTGTQTVRVTNPDTGTVTSAPPVGVYVGNPQACPAGGLAPKSATTSAPTPPSITSLNPTSGLLGSSVSISGSGFAATLSNNSVTFAGAGNTRVFATVASGSTSALTVTVPANAGDGPVTVTVSGLVSNGVNFTVTNPRLSAVLPTTVAQNGTVTLDLTGSKFLNASTVPTVTFSPSTGITAGPVTFIDTGHLQVEITVGASAGLGARAVTVTNASGGSSTLTGAFQIAAPVTNALQLSVQGAAADVTSAYLPSADAVSVTLDSTGKCTAKTVTPTAVTLQAQFSTTTGATPPASVTFTISSSTTSGLPGTAANEDCEPSSATPVVFNGVSLTTPTKDFSIGVAEPTWTTSQQVTVFGGGTYQTTLYSWDWGGTVQITVSGTLADSTVVTGSLTLPVDTDHDTLPDAYENDVALNADASGANVLNPLNPDQNGSGTLDGNDRFAPDGLSNFAKHRGGYLSGPANGSSGAMTGHIRLGTGMRHLFVRGQGFGNDPLILATPGTCGVDSSGLPVADATVSATNPCPPFEVGPAYAAIGVQIHEVTASFTTGTQFPRQSFATPTNPTLDMATVVYDGVNCSGGGTTACLHTTKVGVRQWQFPTLGFSTFGSSTAYGAARVFKKAVDSYFSDRPYEHRANVPLCDTSVTGPCYVLGLGGTPMLAPITRVGDANDNGLLDSGESPGGQGTDGQLASATYIAGVFNRQLSAMDVNADGCVELPTVSDPTTLSAACDPTDLSGAGSQATKRQVVRSVVTHELAHAAGVNIHTADSTDIMYQYTINWVRDGHFSSTAAGLIQIHNKGLQ